MLCYSLGDEGRVSGMGDGPKTDAAFQKYLKGVHGEITVLNRTWDANFKSFNDITVWYWMWSAIGAWQGLQGPDLQAPAPVQAMLRDTAIVRDGLGDLLLQYKMQHDGIAVLYSYPSIFVHGRSERNKSYPSHYAAFLAWHNVIHDLNMQYDFVTENTLTSGDFATRGYKVLVLPQTWVISPDAADAIRRFALSIPSAKVGPCCSISSRTRASASARIRAGWRAPRR